MIWEELQGVTFESGDLFVAFVTMVCIGALELLSLDVSFEALFHGLFILDYEINCLEGEECVRLACSSYFRTAAVVGGGQAMGAGAAHNKKKHACRQ